MVLAALLFLLGTGWEAKVHFTHDPPRKSGGSEGSIHVDGSRVRLEEPTPAGETVVLSVDGKVRLLFPERKQFMEIDPAQAALATVPPLSLAGMKEVGEERLGGQDCAIWERILETGMGVIHQRLWVPRGSAKKKLFFFLREATVTPRGATRADLTELRFQDQPASLFRVPKDYARK